MKKTQLKYIAIIHFGILEAVPIIEREYGEIQWITTANLLPNNKIAKYEQNLSFKPCESLSVKSDDILIRRIAPGYVNYLQKTVPNCYAANNLIVVRATEHVNSKYLAYYLDQNLTKIIKKAAKGTVLPTLARQDLAEFEIILPSRHKQNFIGELWFLEIEKVKLQEQLKILENKKLRYLLSMCIKQSENKQ
jgi:restriction endonuclease S subunit